MEKSQTTSIPIDIDVYRAIEAHRKTFSQSQNDILREVFRLPEITFDTTEPLPPDPPKGRRTGTYVFTIRDERVEQNSLKAAYVSCILKLTELDSGFLEKLSAKTTKSRRIVAKDPRNLYLNNPSLHKKYALRLIDQWWIDTNLSRPQCEQRLEVACGIVGLQFGVDLKLDFPN